jgi:hypothetical protein
MKLGEFYLDRELADAMPMPTTAPSAVGVGVSPTMAPAAGQAKIGVDPQAAAKAQAMAVKQMQDRKKQIQDTIKQKQQEIVDLQKELSTLK